MSASIALAIISAVPTLLGAIKGVFAVNKTTKAVVDVSGMAKEILTTYLELKRDATEQEIELKLRELDASHASELSKLELEFRRELQKQDLELQEMAYSLAYGQIRLVTQDMQSESVWRTGWRLGLAWGCMGTLVGVLVGSLVTGLIGVYLPAVQPAYLFFIEYTSTPAFQQALELITLLLGLQVSARTLEKIQRNRNNG